MAITFTSDKISTRYIKDVSGYKGDKDFTANISFADNLAVNKNWDKININDVLSTARQSKASVLLSSDLNNYNIIDNNTLRISYIPDYASKGLIASNFSSSILTSTLATSASPNVPGIIYALYTTDAAGYLSIAANSDVEIINGDGTFAKPLMFKVKNATTINIVRNNGAQNAHITMPVENSLPFLPHYQSISITADTLTVNPTLINGVSGAIVLRFGFPLRRIDVLSTETKPVFLLKQDANNYVAAYFNKDRLLTLRFYENGSQTHFMVAQKPLKDGINTLALSWQNGVISMMLNGLDFIAMGAKVMSASFNVKTIALFSKLEDWVNSHSEAAIFNLVTYDHSLSVASMAKASNF